MSMPIPTSRVSQCAGRLPAQRMPPSDLCIVVVGLRRQYQAAVFGRRQDRSSGQPLCGDEEGQRADGPFLQPSLSPCQPPACDSLPFTGPGAVPTWRSSCSPRRSSRARRSSSLTMAKCGATSPISTMSPVSYRGLSISVPQAMRRPAGAPARIYNVGNHHPEELTHVVALLEKELGRTAVRKCCRCSQAT